MSLGTTSIDRRSDYYERIAGLIASDPIDFYSRAERGRKIQSKFPWIVQIKNRFIEKPYIAYRRVS